MAQRVMLGARAVETVDALVGASPDESGGILLDFADDAATQAMPHADHAEIRGFGGEVRQNR